VNSTQKRRQTAASLSPTLKLFLCLFIDLIGVLTISVPILGEFLDVVWAPISAYLILWLFGSWSYCALGFFEELLPYTDVIPTATLGWFMERMYKQHM